MEKERNRQKLINQNWLSTKTTLCWIIKTLSHCCGRSDPKKYPFRARRLFFVLALFNNVWLFLLHQFTKCVLVNSMKRLFPFERNLTNSPKKDCDPIWLCGFPFFSLEIFCVAVRVCIHIVFYVWIVFRFETDVIVGTKSQAKLNHYHTLKIERKEEPWFLKWNSTKEERLRVWVSAFWVGQNMAVS